MGNEEFLTNSVRPRYVTILMSMRIRQMVKGLRFRMCLWYGHARLYRIIRHC